MHSRRVLFLFVKLLLQLSSGSCFTSGSCFAPGHSRFVVPRFIRTLFFHPRLRFSTSSFSPKMVTSPYATKPYPVGTAGTPWGPHERKEWLARQVNQRAYADEVLSKVRALAASGKFSVEQYGALSVDPERYPLFAFKSLDWDKSKPACLVTGGVHGYETSGVQGALLFLQTAAEKYAPRVNLVVAPCVSPWGYEHVQRWNNNADDPNRNFKDSSPCEECAALVEFIAKIKSSGYSFTAHIDLHETTNSDEEEFRPAKAARDGVAYEPDYIPDGFYLVGDTEQPQHEWHAAIIQEVKKVTHIAPPDAKGQIIGEKPTQEGCIVYPVKSLNLCAALTGAPYATTTEVYPDSPQASGDICNQAQVAAVTSALDYILDKNIK